MVGLRGEGDEEVIVGRWGAAAEVRYLLSSLDHATSDEGGARM